MWSRLLPLLSFLGLVLARSYARENELQVTEVFRVKSGTEKGGCDGHNVQQWFVDTLTLLKDTHKALLEAQELYDKGITDSGVQKYLRTFFGIDARDASSKSTVVTMTEDLSVVLEALEATDSGDENDKAWIYCDSTFAEKRQWSDISLTEGTGVQDPDGKTIKQAFPETCEEYFTSRNRARKAAKTGAQRRMIPASFVPWWVDDFKQYRFDESGGYCFKALRKNLGGTDDNAQPNTITFCTKNKNWRDIKYKSIGDLPDITEEEVSIKHFSVESLTFLHEMFHYALENENTPDTAYTLDEIIGTDALGDGSFIQKDQAVANPESWTMFALAWHLGKRNPKFTFASSASKLL